MDKQTKKRILIIPNEDGFGPSSLASHIVKELVRRDGNIHITVWNKSRINYNKSLYTNFAGFNIISLQPVWNLIQLAKDSKTGYVSLKGTLDTINNYRHNSDNYPGPRMRTDFDMVVDIGVPSATRWAQKAGIPCITVFDHAWGKTLAMIFDDLCKIYKNSPSPS